MFVKEQGCGGREGNNSSHGIMVRQINNVMAKEIIALPASCVRHNKQLIRHQSGQTHVDRHKEERARSVLDSDLRVRHVGVGGTHQFEVNRAIMLNDSPYVLHEQSTCVSGTSE